MTHAVFLFLLLLSPQDDKPTPRIELKGFLKFEGISFKQGEKTKSSGDTYLLRLAFTDEKGAVFQPTPTLNFIVYDGQNPYGKAQRLVTRESWKVDAAKVSRENVADKTLAYDKKTGELWVAFARADPGFEPRFDLTLEIRGVGAWSWKSIAEDARFESTAKGPDKPEKK